MHIHLPRKLSALKPTASLVLGAAFCLLIVAEIFVLRTSLGFLLKAQSDDPGARPATSVLINFDAYNTAVSRITGGESYEPKPGPDVNPFVPQDSVPTK